MMGFDFLTVSYNHNSKGSMFKIFFSLIFLFSAALPVSAVLNINVDTVKKSVAFVYGAAANGDVDASKPEATGFFVGIPTLDKPPQYYLTFVTARHVVDPQWANCSTPNPARLFLRLNRSKFGPNRDSASVAYVPIDLARENLLKDPYRDFRRSFSEVRHLKAEESSQKPSVIVR